MASQIQALVNALVKLRGSISQVVNPTVPQSLSLLTIAATTIISNAVGTRHKTKKCIKLARCTLSTCSREVKIEVEQCW